MSTTIFQIDNFLRPDDLADLHSVNPAMGRIQQALASIVEDRKEIGAISQRELARRVGCSEPQLSSLLSGGRRLNEKWIIRICDALGVSLSDLEKSSELPADPKAIREYSAKLKRLYAASEQLGFRSVSRMIDDWLEASSQEKTPQVEEPEKSPRHSDYDAPQPAVFVQVPYYERIAAGNPSVPSQDGSLWTDILHSSKKPGWFALRVSGDSMEPDYIDGDVILMDHNAQPKDGDIVAALIDGEEATLKVYRRKGEAIILVPLNRRKYRQKKYDASRVTIQGVLIELVRRAPKNRK